MARPARLRRFAFAALTLTAAACASVAPEPPPGAPWLSGAEAGHPLAGRLWQSAEARFVEPADLAAAARAADFVLLGEKHDNPDHHRIQAWLVRDLVRAGRRTAVAWEMLTGDQQAALDAHLAAHPRDATGLGPAVGWDKSGWPAWALYRPIAEAALDGGLTLLPASLPRATVRQIARQGAEVLGAERVAALRLDRPLPDPALAELREEIVETHCRQLPEAIVAPMLTVTQVKDAEMADAMIRGDGLAGGEGAVLIAGSGHVRRDRGVPWHLARLAPGRGVLTLGLIEVDGARLAPGDYAALYHARELPFDFVWFTPRVDTVDPCEAFAEQLKKARERHESGSKASP